MFELTSTPISSENLRAALGDERAGGFVSFEGWVRNSNEGKAVQSLEYEAFAELALQEGALIIKECHERFKIFAAHCVHRVGHLALNEVAVWVGVSAAHRDEAYRANRFIIDEIKTRLPIWKKEYYVDGEAEWVNCQECYKHAHHHHHHAAPSDESRYYSRQTALPEIGPGGQEKLKQASVLVVGAGGLGCPVLRALAGAGVGHLTLVENDLLEISNLPRQTLYKFIHQGQSKALIAAEELRAFNPFIKVTAWHERLTFSNAENLMSRCDLVLDCTDSLQTKFILHDFCRRLGKPFVMASVYQLEGEVQAFLPESEQACLRCLWPEIPDETGIQNCAEAGVLGAVPGAVGALQAKMAVDILLGRPVEKRRILLNLESYDIDKIALAKKADCWLCSGTRRLTADDYRPRLKSWEVRESALSELVRAYALIDLREVQERTASGPVNFALQSLAQTDVQNFASLNPQKNYLLICQKGRRSRQLAERLRRENLTHFYSLAGGIEGLDL